MELIVLVGAECGQIALYAQETEAGWVFQRRVNDQTPLLIDEPSTEHESEIARTWTDALRLMDEYPWHRLSPRSIHPSFRVRVWEEISQRALQGLVSERRVNDWKDRCA